VLNWVLIIILLTVADLLATLELISMLDTFDLIALYLLTTIVGAFLLFLRREDFKAAKQFEETGLTEAYKERSKGIFKKPNAEDIESLRPMLLVGGVYIPAIVLLVIPGLLSDLVGALITIPAISSLLVNRQIEKTIEENAISTP
jgi:UPF0716 family protein affecting phage T7 exclusion